MNIQQCLFIIGKKDKSRQCSRSAKPEYKGYCSTHYKIVKDTAANASNDSKDFVSLVFEYAKEMDKKDKENMDRMRHHAYNFLIGKNES